jgi:hypothetical protein
VFDVPVASLTEGQLARARSYFGPRGVRLYRFAEAEPGTSDSSQFVFQKALAHDQLDEGVALGLGFLAEVLGAGDRALEVIRGWR